MFLELTIISLPFTTFFWLRKMSAVISFFVIIGLKDVSKMQLNVPYSYSNLPCLIQISQLKQQHKIKLYTLPETVL